MHPLIRLTSTDGKPLFWSGIADLITSSPHGTVIKTAATSRLDALWAQVRESPEEVERLRSEALRPAPAIDLEAVDLARRALIALTGNPLEIFDVLGVPHGDADAVVASVRNLAGRLGGAA